MNFLQKRGRYLLSFIVIGTLIGMAWGRIFGWHRPYVNWAPWDLAQHLADNGRDPRECLDLIFMEIMTPSQAEQRALCVFDYAKVTKDPLACEILMPSTYGLSCLGAARIPTPCAFYDGQKVVWNDGAYQEIQFHTCNTEQRPLGKACCAAARGRFDPSFTGDCDEIETDDPLIKDQCNYEIAVKKLEVEQCHLIKNPNLLAACTLHTSTLSQYPELRTP